MAPKSVIRSVKRSNDICKNLKQCDFKQRQAELKKLGHRDLSSIGDSFIALVKRNKHFKLPDSDSDSIRKILSPHKRSIKNFISKSKAARSKALQKGGIFSLILAAVIPVLADVLGHLITKII